VTLVTAGEQTVTATDLAVGAITGTQVGITVEPGTAVSLEVTGISDPLTAGAAADVTVTARDAQGNVATGYTGTIAFTTSDGGTGVGLPVDYPFTSGDAGEHTFAGGVTLVTAGEQTVTATDLAVGAITGTQADITVEAGAASVLTTTIDANPTEIQTVGTSQITVQLQDAFGNPRTTSGGTVVLSATGLGVLTNLLDNGNGTWTATLTAGAVEETITISGTLDGDDILDTATVTVTLAGA
jgi:hypothetical protein